MVWDHSRGRVRLPVVTGRAVVEYQAWCSDDGIGVGDSSCAISERVRVAEVAEGIYETRRRKREIDEEAKQGGMAVVVVGDVNQSGWRT